MNVGLRPDAERDIAEAMAWYDGQQHGLGDSFLAEAEATLARIAMRPNGYPTTHGTFKRALMRKFPYTVYFRVAASDIVIFAVYHQRRQPDTLAERLSEP